MARHRSSLVWLLAFILTLAAPPYAHAATAPTPTLADLWDGKATWVTDVERIATAFDFHFPSILRTDRELWGYYVHNYASPGDGKFKMGIGRARGGVDGVSWTDDGIVLDVGKAKAWDDRIASFPGVWKDGDTWYAVYEGASEDPALSRGDIGLATSTDGKTFVKYPKNPILRHETTGWERANIGTPSLYKENGTWYLLYHGFDWNVCQIGVASGKSLTELTKSPANPILPVAPDAAAWDSGTTGHRSAIVKDGEFYYFAFEGSTPPPFHQSRWSSGLARTRDLTARWEKCPRNPLIPQTSGGMGYDGPELLKLGDQWHLYVRTPRTNQTQRFRLDPIGAPQSASAATATDFSQHTIYHSPQTPGYSAWCTLWRARDSDLRIAFQQVTGPAEDAAKRKNVTVILGSADEGATWKTLREAPARTSAASDGEKIYAAPASSSFCGHGLAALAGGTLVTALWAGGQDKSGYIQRSADDGLTWSPPIYLRDPKVYKMYPSQVHALRDGRLVLVAGMVKQADAATAKFLLKEFFESRDAGKTWSHLWTMPPEVGLCEESDFVELDAVGNDAAAKDGGDLLFIHRAEHYDGNKYLSSNRLQTIFRRKPDGGWDIGPTTPVPMPHSGYPELLKLSDGSILHIGTDGIWRTRRDLHTWTRLDLPAAPYYPRATQLKDGRVLVVGHVGGDDEYGKVDQSIVQQTFRVNTDAEP